MKYVKASLFCAMMLTATMKVHGAVEWTSFPSCDPVSDPAPDAWLSSFTPRSDAIFVKPQNLVFCSEWNPEYPFNGHRCCAKINPMTNRKAKRCYRERYKVSYCDEMTPEQKLGLAVRHYDEQAYCGVTNGFLVNGKRLIQSQGNRIELRNPGRCTQFGTDNMIAMLKWLGSEVAKEYSAPEFSGVRLVVGDISSPRGGCLAGRAGRRGHASHTNGLDVDLAFLSVKPGGISPISFHNKFDVKSNWWLVKKIFENPYACIRVAFLDRTAIAKLAKSAKGDAKWLEYKRFIRHVRGHKNHLHVRIGLGPGQPGCVANAHPELEAEDENNEFEPPELPSTIPVDDKLVDASDIID
ncbi:MAG: penicillin-insensitive murein endopeptidase [Bdellovibrionota bacterium]